jgi:hypothetical protein
LIVDSLLYPAISLNRLVDLVTRLAHGLTASLGREHNALSVIDVSSDYLFVPDGNIEKEAVVSMQSL